MNEWAARARGPLGGMEVPALFFGGGTPSLWSPREVGRVVEEVSSGRGDDVEVSLEANPGTFGEREAVGYRSAGVTRLSLGVQALAAHRLGILGRVHDGAQALSALRAARGAGFRTCSADVIYGLPGERVEEAVAEVRVLAEEGVDHISAYALTVAEGTPLAESICRGEERSPDEGEVAEAYLAVSEELTSAGYEHYEVSNFARDGHRCVHHLHVWRGGQYVGLGAGAVGCVDAEGGGRVRTRNVRDVARYLAAMERVAAGDWEGFEGLVEEREDLGGEALMLERVMLGLRMSEGVDIEEGARELGVAGWTRGRERAAAELVKAGRLERDGGRVRIPRRAWLWENDTVAKLA